MAKFFIAHLVISKKKHHTYFKVLEIFKILSHNTESIAVEIFRVIVFTYKKLTNCICFDVYNIHAVAATRTHARTALESMASEDGTKLKI